MIHELRKNTTLLGNSGKQYDFCLFSFDDFDDIKRSFNGGGLYLFTNRYWTGEDYKHKFIYIGETGDYNTRFDSHHKEQCIRLNKSNCIGFYSMPDATEEERKVAEDDLLATYSLPCNTMNNQG